MSLCSYFRRWLGICEVECKYEELKEQVYAVLDKLSQLDTNNKEFEKNVKEAVDTMNVRINDFSEVLKPSLEKKDDNDRTNQ